MVTGIFGNIFVIPIIGAMLLVSFVVILRNQQTTGLNAQLCRTS